MSDFENLIGKTISGLRVNDDQSVLVFDHPDGTFTAFKTYGDCCSETWFADITGVSALLGGEVRTTEDVDVDVIEDGRTRQEYDSFYGVKLTTNKGHADIVYRNSSNGYYGGSADLMDKERALPSDLVSITDDWRA